MITRARRFLAGSLLKSFLLLPMMAALVVMVPASAQQAPAPLQSYDVELIIFRTLSSNASPEQWSLEAAEANQRLAIPEDEPAPATTDPAQAAPPPPAPTTAAFPMLPSARFKLTAIEETMKRSRAYQPLAHVGWTQPGYPRDAAQYIPIGSLVPASTGLLGQIALSRGRYLHLTLDLVYTPEGSAERYVLRQTRRMRSNERHYIDHPKFGVIALVTPTAG
jgi:Peptidoglycan-binding protein, CsiV